MRVAMRFVRFAIAAAVVFDAALFPLIRPASAQTFEERWEIVPKANAAEPAPAPEARPAPNEKQEPQPDRGAPAQSSSGPSAQQKPDTVLVGKASFYAYKKGKTASGAPYDRDKLTAASRVLPLGTKLRVTDLKTKKSVDVTVTDRGPAAKGRILDLSLGAAHALGIGDRGVIDVRAEIIG
jgi:rare lipoprotein A